MANARPAASAVLVLEYLLAGVGYAMDIAKELSHRIQFSMRPVAEGQGTLRLALMILACGSLYLGCAPQTRQQGYSIPETYVELLAKSMENQIAATLPPDIAPSSRRLLIG
jgi:hypothetical protein